MSTKEMARLYNSGRGLPYNRLGLPYNKHGLNNAFIMRYEGEGEGEGGEGGESGEGGEGKGGEGEGEGKGKEGKGGDDKNKNKTFTQDDVNRMLADDRRKSQKNRDDLLAQLTKWKENHSLTEQQKDELQQRIDQIQTETLSQQELVKKDREKMVKDWEKEKGKLTSDSAYWKNLYTTEKIQREILDAAIIGDAVEPPQVSEILTPKSKLVEILKDSKPTGVWETRVTLRDVNENGEVVFLELPVTEAVNRMKEMKQYWNLFNSGVKGGLGVFNNGGGGSSLRGSKPPKDHKEYLKWKQANIKA